MEYNDMLQNLIFLLSRVLRKNLSHSFYGEKPLIKTVSKKDIDVYQKTYAHWPPLTFPMGFIRQDGEKVGELCEFTLYCTRCVATLSSSLFYRQFENKCIEIRGWSECTECGLLHLHHFRIYDEHGYARIVAYPVL